MNHGPTQPPGTAPGRGSARFAGLLTREFGITDGVVILMASFFLSALLGSVRQPV